MSVTSCRKSLRESQLIDESVADSRVTRDSRVLSLSVRAVAVGSSTVVLLASVT
jgi:hypothetical protein